MTQQNDVSISDDVMRILLNEWVEEAASYSRNADFYRNLIVEIGEMFGDAAKTSDDGNIGDNVLALKVPELVRKAVDELKHYRLKENAALYHLGG